MVSLVKACQGRGPRVTQGRERRLGKVMWRLYREVGGVRGGSGGGEGGLR